MEEIHDMIPIMIDHLVEQTVTVMSSVDSGIPTVPLDETTETSIMMKDMKGQDHVKVRLDGKDRK